MKHQYYALRCFLLDFWDHSLGECAPSASPAANEALWRAADTNHTSVMRGKRPMTDVPKCIHLLDGQWTAAAAAAAAAAVLPATAGVRLAKPNACLLQQRMLNALTSAVVMHLCHGNLQRVLHDASLLPPAVVQRT
jgi:hypothetical protein